MHTGTIDKAYRTKLLVIQILHPPHKKHIVCTVALLYYLMGLEELGGKGYREIRTISLTSIFLPRVAVCRHRNDESLQVQSSQGQWGHHHFHLDHVWSEMK
jgi:hypothetical protein